MRKASHYSIKKFRGTDDLLKGRAKNTQYLLSAIVSLLNDCFIALFFILNSLIYLRIINDTRIHNNLLYYGFQIIPMHLYVQTFQMCFFCSGSL